MNFIRPHTMLIVAVIGAVFGSYMLYTWFPIAVDYNCPVVTGTITERTPIEEGGVPRVDFTIQVSEPPVVVHAHAQRYLIDQVPDEVRFRYSGDPGKEVFLMEHEENPLWIALFCFATSTFLAVVGLLALRRPESL